MAAKLGPYIDQLASGLDAVIAPRARGAIETWLARLEEWNARIDLTAARSSPELVDLMLADAIFLSPHIPHAASVVDIGAGAGAPGLALALLRDDLRVTLVEPLGKRASFIRTVVGAVGRTDVVVERVRGQSLAGQRAWDVALSRATLPASAWLELGTTLVVPGGSVWVLLAKDSPPARDGTGVDVDATYSWPLTGAARRAVRYRVAF